MPINIPNSLTLFRLILIPAVISLHKSNYVYTSLFILCLSLLTDYFDGYFARKFNQETHFGAIFDPIADKIVTLAFYGYIYTLDLLPWWFVATIFLRNFSQLMSVPILIWWLKKEFFVKPKIFAKWATALSDIFIFIPLYYISILQFIEPLIIVLMIVELYILITYIPRLIQIATGKHDTFE